MTRRILSFLRAFYIAAILPAWLLYYFKIAPWRAERLRRLWAKLADDLHRLGVDPTLLMAEIRAHDLERESRRQTLRDLLADPLAPRLALGALVFVAVFGVTLSLLSHGRIPLFASLASGYLGVSAMVAVIYEMAKDEP